MNSLTRYDFVCVDAIPGNQNIARHLMPVRRFAEDLHTAPADHVKMRDGVAMHEKKSAAPALADPAVANQQRAFFLAQIRKKRKRLERFDSHGHVQSF